MTQLTQGLTTLIVSLWLIQIGYLLIKRRQKHVQAIRRAFEAGTYELAGLSAMRPHPYIFRSLWQASDIYKIASKLGFVIDAHDLYRIVSAIRTHFDPQEGITVRVIERHITEYVRHSRTAHKVY